MLYLILAIISSAMVSIVMRLSEGKVTNNIGMLVVNYALCSLLAAAFAGFQGLVVPGDPLLAKTAAMGCVNGFFYLAAFVLFQLNVRRNGVVLSATFMKLGLLVAMVVSVCFYREIPGMAQTVGFALAVGAIILINYEKEPQSAAFRAGLIWLLLIGGMADAMSKIFEESGVPGMEPQFLFYTFATALILSVVYMLAKKQRAGKWEILFGLLIGIPNLLSSKFLLRALEDVAAVIVYPVFSVACILTVTLAGVVLFRERLKKQQWAALGIILAALVLLNI